MIEYVEIRDTSRNFVGIIDTAKSVIWHSVWYGVGDFEIYAQATENHLNLLRQGYYVTRPNDENIGIIEKVEITFSDQDGLMIIASGRFAKSILDRRLIYQLSGTSNKATILTGNVESAARALVANNMISCTFDTKRNVAFVALGEHSGSTVIIVDDDGDPAQKQVSYKNLLEYTDELLQEYEMSAKIVFDEETKNLLYVCESGNDRTIGNPYGNEQIIFSREYDNLTESDYIADNSLEKNAALIGGEGEGIERFYATIIGSQRGLNRREMWVDASSISKKYTDDQDQEHTYTNAQYRAMLVAEGKQEMSEYVATESFSGTINVTFGMWQLNRDFKLGDLVTVQDNTIGKYADVRILEVTEVQDENGYTVTANYQQ